ncbi:MAG: response regulator [Phycisphaerae bacterium]|nr:response regulator [Phycisphaerae bacterium]
MCHANGKVNARLQRLSRWSAVLTALIAGAVLWGWSADIEVAKRVAPGLIAMNPLTAICFLLSSACLLMHARQDPGRWRPLLCHGLATVVVVAGVLRLAGYLLGLEAGLDRVLFAEALDADPAGPNRMAPNTAVCFVLLGIALLLIDVDLGGRRPAQVLALAVGVLALLAILGYIYGVSWLYGIGAFIPMALHTGWLLLIVALGMMLARPDAGYMRLVTAGGSAGLMARRLLPAALLGPPILGSLELAGEYVGLYDRQLGTVLAVVAMIVVWTGLIGVTSGSLHRLELALERTRDEALRASQAKSEFLAAMSHELRTPLHGVLGMTDLLLGTELNAQQRRYAWMAKSSGDALLGLINDVLDFSKIEAGKLDLEEVDFELTRTIERVCAGLRSTAESKGLRLDVELPPAAIGVRGDPVRLQQVLTNLVNNAIKFTERGHVRVRVELQQPGPEHLTVRVSVSDTGIGIPPDRVHRLFESFSQVDTSTTRRFGGTGLGLAICKRLVELMGGRISFDSAVGQGSTFWFELTLRRGAAPATNGPAPGVPVCGSASERRRAHVLLAEDHPISQEVGAALLRRAGYECDVVGTGREALDAVRTREYDLVLMDCQMPEMDGFQAARAIREAERAAAGGQGRLPIIALTANAVKGDRERCLEAGMDDYISKPLDPKRLYALIESHIAREAPVHRLEAGATRRQPLAPPLPAAPPAAVGEPGSAGATAGAGTASRPPIDFPQLLALHQDRAFVLGLVSQFKAQVRRELDLIQRSLAEGDGAAAARVAHGLKGSAGFMGAARVQALAAELEGLGVGAGLDEANRVLAELQREIERCLAFDAEAAEASAPR